MKMMTVKEKNSGQSVQLENPRHTLARRFLDSVIIEKIESEGCETKVDLRSLLEQFRADNPGPGADFGITNVLDEVSGRVVEKYRPGETSPELLVKIYILLVKELDR